MRVMGNPYGRVVLVTGASSGIGQSIAQLLDENGFIVYGTTRKPVQIEGKGISTGKNLTEGKGFTLITLDVTDEESIAKAVRQIQDEAGGVDILVNCAGIGIAGAVEDISLGEGRTQFETNFFGALNMIRSVLPDMRRKKRGLIVNISSVAALLTVPYQSMYSASKSALESATESLRMELRPFGINVAMILPGDTKTGFTDARFFAKAMETSPYREAAKQAVSVMEKDERNGKPPVTVARQVLRIINKKNPPVRVTVGGDYKLLVFLRRLLPDRLILTIVMMIYCKGHSRKE